MSQEKYSIQVMNMTNFFNKEMLLYSLGDFKLPRPVSLKKAAYVLVGFIVWAFPILFIFGVHVNVYFLFLIAGPPILFGIYASKPIFGGKSLIDFCRTMIRFFSRPRCWTDLQASNLTKPQELSGEFELWISRRRELRYLAHMKAQKGKR